MNIISFEEFEKMFEEQGIEISQSQYDMLDKYAHILVEYNKVMNLTGITDPMGISEKHFLDSLLIFKYCDIPQNGRVIDVGTGAGFPGVPMKIYRHDLDVTLLDSLMKRVKFLEAVAVSMPVQRTGDVTSHFVRAMMWQLQELWRLSLCWPNTACLLLRLVAASLP